MSEINYSTLAGCLSDVPDPRNLRGRRYEWLYILEIMAVALLAGQRNVRAMAQWAVEHQAELVACLQPRQKRVPSVATLYRALSKVPIGELELRVSRYSEQVDQAECSGQVVTQGGTVLRGQAVDGKTVRGASHHGATEHLTSLVRHASGIVLAETATAVKLDERTAARQLLTPERVRNTVTTFDALHTQRRTAKQILAGDGHYLMVVKRNQRLLHSDIALAWSEMPPQNATEAEFWGYAAVTTVDKGHGRLERRTLERMTALTGYLDWPGAQQVLRRTCRRTNLRTGETTVQVHYAVTSLAPAQVTLRQLEHTWREHWTIENKVHYVRDVSLGEDAGQLHTGHAAQALAALRNAVITLLRSEGWPCLPTAFRHFAAHPQHALQLMGATTT
jgi:predicted transposase YbfD/YdcC